jgi:gluconokinase
MEASSSKSPQISVVVVMGVAGSGKTTIGRLLSETLGWQFADGDAFHPPENIEKMRHAVPLDDEDRTPWLMTLQAAVRTWRNEHKCAVLACSALKETYRQVLSLDARVAFVYLKGDFALFQARLVARRGHYMSADMLESQMETLEEPTNALIVDAALTPIEIVNEITKRLSLG